MIRKSDGVRVELDPAMYSRIVSAMRGLEGLHSEAYVLSRAATETAKEAKQALSKKAGEVYEGPRSMGIASRASVKKGTVKNGATATVFFRSDLPGMSKFQYGPKTTRTRFSKTGKKHVQKIIMKDGEVRFRMLGEQKKYDVWVSQLRSTGPQKLEGAFVTRFGRHIAIAQRKDPTTLYPNKKNRLDRKIKSSFTGAYSAISNYPIRDNKGSSDMAMVRNKKVYGAEKDKINHILLVKCGEVLTAELARAK